MTTPKDSSHTAAMNALNSGREMSFWIFEPLSRQIYTMNSKHHKDCLEHLCQGLKLQREKLYTANIHIFVLVT